MKHTELLKRLPKNPKYVNKQLLATQGIVNVYYQFQTRLK